MPDQIGPRPGMGTMPMMRSCRSEPSSLSSSSFFCSAASAAFRGYGYGFGHGGIGIILIILVVLLATGRI
jgi:hypothetical protein